MSQHKKEYVVENLYEKELPYPVKLFELLLNNKITKIEHNRLIMSWLEKNQTTEENIMMLKHMRGEISDEIYNSFMVNQKLQ